MRFLLKSLRWGLVLGLLGLGLILGNDAWINQQTQAQLFSDLQSVPYNPVGLLLGTSKRLANGRINRYYQYRLDAAVALFNAGKIDTLLVSGDNSTKHYNEVATFQADLIAAGIPADKIVLDYAGFRTLDSVVRAEAVFGQSHFTVISQPFHNARAVYIAQHKNLKAIGFNARDVNVFGGFKTQLREKFARLKMQLDLLFGVQPKFLGEPVPIQGGD